MTSHVTTVSQQYVFEIRSGSLCILQSEKLKHLLSSRYLSGTSDPHAALARDVVLVGGVSEHEPNQINKQVATLEALVTQQRCMQFKMAKVLKDAELRHRAVCIIII